MKIYPLDIDKYIISLSNNGLNGHEIVITLYDCQINGIDTLEKAEKAYAQHIQKKQNENI